MSHLIEPMESRTLFSASSAIIEADALALQNAGTQAKADLTADAKLAAADTKAVKAAALATHPSSVQKASLTAFLKAEAADAKALQKQITNILNSGNKAGNQLKSALRNLNAHPNSSVAQAKAVGAVSSLQTIFSDAVVSGVEASVDGAAATLDIDSSALATTIPATLTANTAFQAHLSTDQSTVITDATAITTALTTIKADLSA